MLTGQDLSLAELKARAEGIRQRLLPHHREVHLQYPYENIGTREMLSTAAATTPMTNLQNACVTTE